MKKIRTQRFEPGEAKRKCDVAESNTNSLSKDKRLNIDRVMIEYHYMRALSNALGHAKSPL